jgi:hypothetical protein
MRRGFLCGDSFEGRSMTHAAITQERESSTMWQSLAWWKTTCSADGNCLMAGTSIVFSADVFAFNQAFRWSYIKRRAAHLPVAVVLGRHSSFLLNAVSCICPRNGAVDLVASDPNLSSSRYAGIS